MRGGLGLLTSLLRNHGHISELVRVGKGHLSDIRTLYRSIEIVMYI